MIRKLFVLVSINIQIWLMCYQYSDSVDVLQKKKGCDFFGQGKLVINVVVAGFIG